jgi:glutamyl-tRNA synthetase
MLLGWAPPGEDEIVPWETIESTFDLADVKPSPAFFDEKKLKAFNGEYIRRLSVAEFIEAVRPWLSAPAAPWEPAAFDADAFAALAPLAQSRVSVLSEIVPMVDFLFLPEAPIDDAAWAKAMKGPAAELLADVHDLYDKIEWEAETLKAGLTEVGERHGLKLGKAQAPVRVAVTGRSVGLPLFESLEALGRETTLRRLAEARERLTGG